MRRTNSSQRRATQQASKAGEEIGLARVTAALSQSAVADRAGVSWSTVDRIERGDPSVGLETLCAVGEAVGIDIVVRAYPSHAPSLRDTGQLEIAELLRAQAHPSWHVAAEVRAGPNGEAIDLGFLGPDEILDIEIERMATDFQAQFRRAPRSAKTSPINTAARSD
jgi:transcriptional regulator with XRE-family HTH domain